ncbi:MAG: RagB/SusD family nutrient uptake outer membrane protein [Draconibacterium sp.]|nr:RagB/SusD family nutrient uptake outer membrane protein [Draconibacterium sp.]
MKNIKKFKGIILVLLLTLSFSCSEEFLQEAPLSFLSPENTFVDAAGIQTALDDANRRVFDQINGEGRNQQFNWNMSDVAVVSKTDRQTSYADLRDYLTPQNRPSGGSAGRTYNFYNDNYKGIKSCNTVIDYIDNVEWAGGQSDAERNHILGTAYFMRSFFYLQLTMEFGNVAFPLNVVTKARQDFKAFNMQGIWDQMIVDLEFAVQHMKPSSELAVGQPPLAAARMWLAKYYMLNERFADAEAQLSAVINSSEHVLFTDDMVDVDSVRIGNNINAYAPFNPLLGQNTVVAADAVNRLFQNAGSQKPNNSEGIWTFINAPGFSGAGGWGRSARVRAYGPNFGTKSFFIETPDGKAGINIGQGKDGQQMQKWGRGQGFARPSNYSEYEIWNYDGETDWQDYRHKLGNWFKMEFLVYDNKALLNGDPESEKWWGVHASKYREDGQKTTLDSVRCWYDFPLYKFWAQNFEDRIDRQDGGKQDIYILRLAHTYLLRAEARFWQGNYQGCADDINVIRARANAKKMYTAADVQTDGIEAVLAERARELWGEEYRHDELMRISVIFAKTGKTCYNGKTYSTGADIEKSLSESSFTYDRIMEVNNFYRDQISWVTYPDVVYSIDPHHVWWPVYEAFLIGNVRATLNQTTGYDGAENNIEPLIHVVQPAGLPNVDPQYAVEPPE